MDIPRIFTISESEHRIHNPFTPEKYATLGRVLRMKPDKPVAMPAQDSWRVRLAMAREWRDVVNKHGGDVTVMHLPQVGIKGNTHFPFSDLNNVQIADLVSQFLKEKALQ